MLKRLLIVDTETTDLLTNDPEAEIIEIAAAVLDLQEWRILHCMHSLIQHSRPLCDFTKKHFAGVDFKDARPLDFVLECLLNMWTENGGAWLGQNPGFDLDFIKPAAKRFGLTWPTPPEVDYHRLDLASMMLPYVLKGDCQSVSLRNSRKWAGVLGEQTHRAIGDVSDVISVLAEIIARSYPSSWTDKREQTRRFGFSAANFVLQAGHDASVNPLA